MTAEVERKYLVRYDAWRELVADSVEMVQGYVAVTDKGSVRVRVKGPSAYLTIKSRRRGDRRDEYEYAIDVTDARGMLANLCGAAVVSKVRHQVPFGDLVVEVDEFTGLNVGLILAEIELPAGKTWPETLPAWFGDDVTEDDRYYSSQLAATPYSTW